MDQSGMGIPLQWEVGLWMTYFDINKSCHIFKYPGYYVLKNIWSTLKFCLHDFWASFHLTSPVPVWWNVGSRAPSLSCSLTLSQDIQWALLCHIVIWVCFSSSLLCILLEDMECLKPTVGAITAWWNSSYIPGLHEYLTFVMGHDLVREAVCRWHKVFSWNSQDMEILDLLCHHFIGTTVSSHNSPISVSHPENRGNNPDPWDRVRHYWSTLNHWEETSPFIQGLFSVICAF